MQKHFIPDVRQGSKYASEPWKTSTGMWIHDKFSIFNNLTLYHLYLIIHVTGDNFCWRKCWNIKKNGFHKNEKFRLKGAASTKRKWLLLKGMVSTKGNDFHEKQRLSLKGMASTTGNGFH